MFQTMAQSRNRKWNPMRHRPLRIRRTFSIVLFLVIGVSTFLTVSVYKTVSIVSSTHHLENQKRLMHNDMVIHDDTIDRITNQKETMQWWCEATIPYSQSRSNDVAQIWQRIDNTTATFPKAKVSGGLFLYPRQANLISRLIHNLIDSKILSSSSSSRPFQICETGFGAGHSTAFFLSQSETIQLTTFDKFDRPYQTPILAFFEKEIFHERIMAVEGNSCKTVPEFFQNSKDSPVRCNLLHGSSLCPTDNIDLVNRAQCGTVLTSTAMHSLEDEAVYFGPKAQWRELRRNGCIENIVCFEEEPRALNRSFIFAQEGKVIKHQFCFAMVTGACSRADDENEEEICNRRKDAVKTVLHNLCPRQRVAVPA